MRRTRDEGRPNGRRRGVGSALLLLSTVLACDGSREPDALGVAVSEGRAELVVEGVLVEVALPAEFRVQGRLGSEEGLERTIEGHPFGVRSGRFFIGDRGYGPVSAGETVRVDASGVTIAGELRGPVPPRAR